MCTLVNSLNDSPVIRSSQRDSYPIQVINAEEQKMKPEWADWVHRHAELTQLA